MNEVTRFKNFTQHPCLSLKTVKHRIRETWRHHTTNINTQPIFVFGNQKSGTSAIAALLGEMTGRSYTIDIFCHFGDIESQLLGGQASLNEFIQQTRFYFSRDIVKDPSLTFFYDELKERFPNAERIFVLRDPRQNIRSILNRLGLPGNLNDLSPEKWHQIAITHPAWLPVLDGKLAGHQGKSYIETLALRCQKTFQIYLQNRAEVIPIYYEAFKADKSGAIQALAQQLGLPIRNDITALKDIQFQPKGNATVPLDIFFGPENLSLIETICGETMMAVGYSL